MENALSKITGGASLALADAQGFARELIMLFRRLASETQAWAKADKSLCLIVIGTVGTTGLVLLGSLIFLRIRTRRKAQLLQEALAKQMTRAELAESANQAKARLLAKMSRQIRTQLNSILGFTDLALKTDLHPELREYMDTVRMSAYWLMNVADNVVEFSQIQAGKLQLETRPFSISDCIASVMKIVGQDAAAKKLSTTCKVDPRLPHAVCGDPTRLRHVIFNLIDNAVRFTITGGVIISVTVEAESADDVTIAIAVIDTGMGIPVDKHPFIFEPFGPCNADADDEYHGSGMGLAISRRLVDLMGGTMRFQSHLGAGSRFEFTARFRKYGASAPEVLNSDSGANGLREFSILVAEDNTINRRLIAKILESSGSRVQMVTNGKEAVEAAQTDSFDLILMDMEMPDLDGLEATRVIRSAEPAGSHVPIYALTAHSFAVDRDRCFEAGMDGFFTKPVATDEILQLISQLKTGAPVHKRAGWVCEMPAPKLIQNEKQEIETPTERIATQPVEASFAATEAGQAMSDAFDDESKTSFTATEVDQAMSEAFDDESQALLAATEVDQAMSDDFDEERETSFTATEASQAMSEAFDDESQALLAATEVDQAMSDDFEGESEAAFHAFMSHPPDLAPNAPVSAKTPRLEESHSDLLELGEALGLSETSSLLDEEWATPAELVSDTGFRFAESDLNSEDASSGEEFTDQQAAEVAEPVGVLACDREFQSVEEPALVAIPATVRENPCAEPERNDYEVAERESAPIELAFPKATYQITWQSPSPAKEDTNAIPDTSSPFEQARHALYRSRFDVRIVHNNGDPSDRDLI